MKKFFVFAVAAVLLASCGKTDKTNTETVSTGNAADITMNSARLYGSANPSKLYSGVSVGVVLSVAKDVTAENGTEYVAESTDKDGKFHVDVRDLIFGTTYYYRAFLKAGESYWYGDVKQFTTTAVTAGYFYELYKPVDLGLSVKWASCNLGASSPEQFGDYYAWGETQTKELYDWAAYKWGNEALNSFNKYNTLSSYGPNPDNKTELENSDDAAYVLTGGALRMPTKVECDELFSNCTYEKTSQNGVNGILLTSRKNEGSIFLPTAGWMSEYGYANYGRGNYWSRSLVAKEPNRAYSLDIESQHFSVGEYCFRFNGYSIRPVME